MLKYYHEVDPDPMKLKAAEHLISNMIYQYSRFGPGVDSLNETYKYTYEVYRNDRLKVFSSDSVMFRREAKIEAEYDLKRITSDYLIGQIESAFDTYERYEWTRWYPFEIFCEYILPYKIGHSDTVNWRTYAYQKYGILMDYSAFESSAAYYEAEAYDSLNRIEITGASGNQVTKLEKDSSSSFELNFHIKWNGYQLFNLHYLNGHTTAANIRITIDSVEIGDFIFPATGSWQKVDKNVPPVDFTVMLDSGEHTLRLEALDKGILLDFLYVPEYIYMALPQSAISEGEYYIRNALGMIAADSLVNEAGLKVRPDTARASKVKVIAKDGNLYHLVIQKDSTTRKALDAFPFGDSDWVIVYNDHGYQNQQWAFVPYDQGYQIRNRETGKILAFRESDSVLVQLPVELMRDEYVWYLEKTSTAPTVDSTIDMSVRAAQKISEITNRFHWSGSYVEIGPVNPTNILEYAYGSCVEETDFQTMVLRSMGVACAVDFVFNYPERNAGHSWSVIFDLEGNAIQNNCHNPVGAGTWVDEYAKGKVYRKTNSINYNSLFFKNKESEKIPPQFQNPYFFDVTPEYCEVKNIEIEIAEANEELPDFGYLMVFNNARWVPTAWGERSKKIVEFNDLEPRGMYLPSFYTNGAFSSFNNPFYFDSTGNVHHVPGLSSDSVLVSLKRKYPNRLVDESYHKLTVGGKFQGANKPDFSDSVTIGTITQDMTDPLFYVINVASKQTFKYLRYLGPPEGRCNINEIYFFDSKGDTISGDIIGTEGSFENSGKTKEMVFDGDVLTYFDAPDPSGGWVGLRLDNPSSVSKVRFATRNDGNMVEIGDEYELVCWDKDDWVSLGKRIADSDSLLYTVPLGTVYWLKNHTKGWEERIFTLDENNQQVWW